MARPLSEEKREAILASALEQVAAHGTGAPTARIAKGAGLAEGTLFKYFASKDELLNKLYLAVKADFARAMLDAYPADGSVRERSRHVWDGYIDWGLGNPAKRKTMRQLSVSDRITAESRGLGNLAFQDVNALLEEALSKGPLKNQPPAFAGALLEAIAETTLEFIARDPNRREEFKRAGFEVFWNGIAG